jgi:hypothetical protein
MVVADLPEDPGTGQVALTGEAGDDRRVGVGTEGAGRGLGEPVGVAAGGVKQAE